MSYLVIARKWRPARFEDLVGQEPIARLLKNSIEQGHVAHAYIFSGPRGVGKTSTARILARALNCEQGPTPTPCGTCRFCTAIATGSSIDVLEIDGASNTGVDDVRELREQIKYAPSAGRYKVYIIDEAHMLSPSAFNALLKTLEEPPPHVVFVLATTAPKKIPLTVFSRCQHLPFRRIPLQKIKERLQLIAGREGIKITPGGLDALARAGDGSLRDCLTMLDQLSASLDEIDEPDIREILGMADTGDLLEITAALLEGDREKILEIIGSLSDTGADLRAFARDLTKFMRDVLVMKLVKSPEEILDMGGEAMDAVKKRLPSVSADYLTLMLAEVMKAESDVRLSAHPRVGLEMSLIKASYLSTLQPIGEAISRLGGSGVSDAGIDIETKTPDVAETGKDMDVPAQAAETGKERVKERVIGPPAPQTGKERVIDPDGNALLKLLIERIEDPRIAARLSGASTALNRDTLALTVGSEMLAEPLRENIPLLGKLASELRGIQTNVAISVNAVKTPGKKELKERLLSEPAVRSALELFDGRLVDVRLEKNGGDDV